MKRIVLGACALTALAACGDPTKPAEPSPTRPTAAAVAQRFTIQDLGTLGGTFSQGNAINEAGEVAGVADLPSGEVRAMLWRAGQGMQSLGTLGGDSRARGINDRSEVTGVSETAEGTENAFLWTESTGMRSLGTLGGDNSAGNAINNRGEVVGFSETRKGRDPGCPVASRPPVAGVGHAGRVREPGPRDQRRHPGGRIQPDRRRE